MKKNDNLEVLLELQEISAIKDIVKADNFQMDDGYLKRELECINYLTKNIKKSKHVKARDNKYYRKNKTKQKLKKLNDKRVYFVTQKSSSKGESYYQRFYLSGCRKYAKKETNRKIRCSRNDFKLNGCAYRRKFDYWNTLF